MLLLNSRAKKPFSQKGFSMMEVLVAILTLTLFLTGTLQLVAIDALYKMRSKQEAQAQFWIQEDLEEILSLANKTNQTIDPENPDSFVPASPSNIWYDAACIPEMRTEDEGNKSFAQALRDEIKNSSDLPGASPKTLLAQDGVSQNPKTYEMKRSFNDAEIDAHTSSVLKITYQVIDVDAQANSEDPNNDINKSDDYVIATHYAEVIPHESFKCR